MREAPVSSGRALNHIQVSSPTLSRTSPSCREEFGGRLTCNTSAPCLPEVRCRATHVSAQYAGIRSNMLLHELVQRSIPGLAVALDCGSKQSLMAAGSTRSAFSAAQHGSRHGRATPGPWLHRDGRPAPPRRTGRGRRVEGAAPRPGPGPHG